MNTSPDLPPLEAPPHCLQRSPRGASPLPATPCLRGQVPISVSREFFRCCSHPSIHPSILPPSLSSSTHHRFTIEVLTLLPSLHSIPTVRGSPLYHIHLEPLTTCIPFFEKSSDQIHFSTSSIHSKLSYPPSTPPPRTVIEREATAVRTVRSIVNVCYSILDCPSGFHSKLPT